MNQQQLKTKLFDAIEKNDFYEVNNIVNTDIDLYQYKDEFRLSLYYNNLEMTKYWVKKGANIHDDDEWALKFVTKNDYNEIFDYLISENADVYANKGEVLKTSIEKCNMKITKFLLENYPLMKMHLEKMSLDIVNSNILNKLIVEDNVELLKLMFNSGYIIDQSKNYELIIASQKNSIKILTWLVEELRLNFYIDSDYSLKTSARKHNYDTTLFLYNKYNNKEKALNIIKDQGYTNIIELIKKYDEAQALSYKLTEELNKKNSNTEEIKIKKLKI